jgi:hypothetical protein
MSKIYVVIAIFIFAVFYAYRYFGNGFYLPEEPYILDFSGLLRIPINGIDIGMPLGTYGQISIAFPWSGLSLLWYKMGGDTYGHVQLVLFIRTFIVVYLTQRFYRYFMTDALALIFASLAFSTPPIKSAVLYSHWFSHIVFVLAVLLYFLDDKQRTNTEHIVKSVLITSLTVSVFSNPPHLVTAWLVLPVGLVVTRGLRIKGFQEAFKKSRILIATGIIIYAIPTFFYLQNWSILKVAKPSEMFSSRGETFINGLMGFGSWWIFDKYTGSDLKVYFYDLANFELTSISRTLIRSSMFLLAAGYLLFRADKLDGRLFRDPNRGNRSFYVLLVISSVFVFLSSLGRFNWFWSVREMLPSILGMFREPYPKFAPQAQIYLYAMFGAVLSIVCSKFLSRKITFSFAIIAIFMISPIFNTQLGATNLHSSSRDPDFSWSRDSIRSLEDAAESLKNYKDDFCLFDMGWGRFERVFFKLRQPQLFRNLWDLVPTSEREAYLSTGKELEQMRGCKPNDDLALVLRSKSQNVYSDQDALASTDCVVDSNEWFMLFKVDCISNTTVRIGSDLINKEVFLSGARTSYPVFESTEEPSWISIDDPFWMVHSARQPIAGTIKIEYTDAPFESFGNARKSIELPFSGGTTLSVRGFLPCFDYNDSCWTGVYSVELQLGTNELIVP